MQPTGESRHTATAWGRDAAERAAQARATRVLPWWGRAWNRVRDRVAQTYQQLRLETPTSRRSPSPRIRQLHRALWLGSFGYPALVALIAIFIWTLGDRWWPATMLLFIGRWIFLVPFAALIPTALVMRRALLLPLLAGVTIVLGPIMGVHTGWKRNLPHDDGTHIRVMTFNADGGDRLAASLPVVLAAWEPDIVALQECGDTLAATLAHLSGWNFHRERGLCFVTHFPIRSADVMDRNALEHVHEDETAGIGGSGDVVRYTLDTPGGTIAVTNLHLETPRKGLEGLAEGVEQFDVRRLKMNTELRDIESDLARRWVDRSRAPVLVLGDFNTPVESRIFQEHWGDLRDVFSDVGIGLGMTKYNGWIRVRIDHILVGSGWHPDQVRVERDLGSDHRPVIADLTLFEGDS